MPTAVELPIANASPPAAQAELTRQKLQSLGVLWPSEVDRIVAEETQTQFLVEGLLPVKSIAIAAGDSTIGKSPLFLQLALSVAGGVPFLGMQTSQGRVLYFDLENSLSDAKGMRDALVRFLGLSHTPEDFLVAREAPADLERLIAEVRPQLVVVDSVRSFRPDVSAKNENAGEFLKQVRKLSRNYGSAFLMVHHLRKPPGGQDGAPVVTELQSNPVATWMLQMEGARALVNQTDVRIGVAS